MLRKYRPTKTVLLLVLISALCTSFLNYNLQPLESNSISSSSEIQPLDLTIRRKLVTDLGNGECEWVDGVDVDQDLQPSELFSTAIVAFPGAGKRIAFLQLEALTELNTRDDFWPPTNITKYAFFKTQYPHHEGTWGWGDKCSQSVYLLTNPKMALITYLFILHEIHYAKTVPEAYINLDRVFTLRAPIDDWVKWRNERVNAEIHWWSWHIDYWMEGGLLRDMFTHELTTSRHFDRIMAPTVYTEAELRNWQSELTNVEPEYDSHCHGGDMNDCSPTAIASYEKMMDPSTGPQEVAKFTSVIEGKAGINFVAQVARQCAWEQIVIHKASGRRDARDREGPPLQDYDFEASQLLEMTSEIERIRDKYSVGQWSSNTVAQDLVGYMNEYLAAYEADPDLVY